MKKIDSSNDSAAVGQGGFDLSKKHSFRFPARSWGFISLSGGENLSEVFSDLSERSYWILGEGSNTVFCEPFEGVIVQPRHRGMRWLQRNDNQGVLRVGAAENWHQLVSWTLSRSWFGLENLALIPGSVGAAPVQNIGAYGREFSDSCERVCVWDILRSERREILAKDCLFGYRDSLFKQNPGRYMITEVDLKLSRKHRVYADYQDIRDEIRSLHSGEISCADVARAVCAIRRRKLPDPEVLGNAGSFFKNPIVDKGKLFELKSRFPPLPFYDIDEGTSKCAAGWMIDHLGWKGFRSQGVGVHQEQALVLIHEGGAQVGALLELAGQIRKSVFETFGLWLEPEVQLLGAEGKVSLER